MAELPVHIHDRITSLCAEGDDLASRSKYGEALRHYQAAWDLLPEPRLEWDAAVWIQTAIADAHFLAGEFSRALDALKAALLSGGLGNPFVHLRRGQCLFETGDRDGAVQELTRAYMGAGREIFEPENPKYFETLRGVLKPPVGQDDL